MAARRVADRSSQYDPAHCMHTQYAALSVSLAMAFAQAKLPTTAGPAWSDLNPVTHLTAETFAHPPATDRPWVRMNTPADLSSELKVSLSHGSTTSPAGL